MTTKWRHSSCCGLDGLGHGRGLFGPIYCICRGLTRLRLGRSARLICVIHSSGCTTGCMLTRLGRLGVGLHESNMLNSYNRLNNRLDNWLNVC